jgi:hypothetical protein
LQAGFTAEQAEELAEVYFSEDSALTDVLAIFNLDGRLEVYQEISADQLNLFFSSLYGNYQRNTKFGTEQAWELVKQKVKLFI